MKFYTVGELSDLLRLSSSQVYALIEEGRLKCHRFTRGKSGGIRISQAQLDEFLQATSAPSAPVETPPQAEPPLRRPAKKAGVELW
jgi:excisionase family DNA binding protein